jgi:hypothetical protein
MTAVVELARLLEGLGRDGVTVIDLACGGRAVELWTLYPGEYGIFDRKRGSQVYFHRHAGARHEAGHFHTVRLFPDRAAHLVGISMAEDGWPQALFTVNLWATGEAHDDVENLKHYVRRFQLDERRGPALLVRFVNLVFRAFRTEIERLQDEKAAAIDAYRAARRGRDPFEDRSLEILSRAAIDVRARAAKTAVV